MFAAISDQTRFLCSECGSPVASLGCQWEADPPGWHHPGRWHPVESKKNCGWILQRVLE